MKWLNNLKKKWKIKDNLQLLIIFIVFGITGSLSLIVSEPLLKHMGLNEETMNPWIFTPLKLVLIFPVYQILILIIGWAFGQIKFFWAFEKKMLSSMGLSRFFKLK